MTAGSIAWSIASRAVAGSTIPPAHPRTKIIGHEPRHELALDWRWHAPAGLSEEEAERLRRDQIAHDHRSLAQYTPPVTSPPYTAPGRPGRRFRDRSCAGRPPDGSRSRRVARLLDWNELRSKLHLNPEPPIDPETVQIDQLHLSRLALVPVERLDDGRLLALYRQAAKWGLRRIRNRAGPGYRPAAFSHAQRPDRADHTLRRISPSRLPRTATAPRPSTGSLAGAQAESPQKRSANALAWEMIGLEVKMLLDEPEVWVPSPCRHPGAMSRKSGGDLGSTPPAGQSWARSSARVDPKRPDQLMLDTRILDQYLKRYGPRVTTATGELGVAASQNEIWTPESAGAPSSIWTPGSASPPARSAEKSKLILPGQ